MTGSGTIGIEAALMGRGEPLWRGGVGGGRAPAALRLPAFAGWPDWCEPLFGDTEPLVIASEIDPRSAASARAHVAAAQVSRWVQVAQGDFRALAPEWVAGEAARVGRTGQAGVILVNPPYGARLDEDDPVPLYRELGAWCRRFRGWRAGVLVAHREFENAFGGRPRIVKPLSNANQPSVFYLFDL
jgi:23S rRNA G2445 N2-methylase RlmL